MRIALGVEYDGTRYMGWQRQPHGPTIQGELEKALTSVAASPVVVICAGRTDTGVHGLGQVVHFDTAAERTLRGWVLGANSALPADIAVRWAHETTNDFNARFSAESRRYNYLILNRPVRSALHRDRAFLVREPLDDARMNSACVHLLGKHDFSSFRASRCQAATAVRNIMSLNVTRSDDWLCIDVIANAFLQHMVRNLTGLLVSIGRGDLPVEAAGEILRARNRTLAPFAAPASGLYLLNVCYPDYFGLPVEQSQSFPSFARAAR